MVSSAAPPPASYQRAAIASVIQEMPTDAPGRTIVQSSSVQDTLTAFEAADAFALAAQARYRSWGRRGLQATTFGILVGAILLFPLEGITTGWVRTGIGAFQTLALLMTFGAMLFITWLRPLDQWMIHRAEAERLRGKIFEAIIQAPAPATQTPRAVAEGKLLLLLGAYINDQLLFFDKRATELKRAASKISPLRVAAYTIILCAFLLGLAALIGTFGLPTPGLIGRIVALLQLPDASRWQLGLTTMASGLLAYATARTLMDEDERKAALYLATAKKLRRLLDRDHAAVAAAAAAGDEAPVCQLFEKARQILAQEHAVWSFIRERDDEETASG